MRPSYHIGIVIGLTLTAFFLGMAPQGHAASVTLQWDANNPTPQGYRLFQRAEGQNYDYSQPVWTGSDTTCIVNGLLEGNTYYFVVRAYDNSDESGDSNEVDYTVSVTIPPDTDSDGDGIVDSVDAFPSDPSEWIDTDSDGTGNNADTDDDNDGMPDTWENQYGLDPLVDDAAGDLDRDGNSNIDEYTAGSDPSQSPSNQAPQQPVLSQPGNGATVALTPALTTGAFSDPDGDRHGKTQYQISTAADFSAIVLDRTTSQQLTRYQVFELALDPDTTYYWRARFYDEANAASTWSAASQFITVDSASWGDTDASGIMDNQEAGADIDLDGDGTVDLLQAGIMTVQTGDPANPYIAVKRQTSGVQVSSLMSLDPSTITNTANQPLNLRSLISFKLLLDPGITAASVTVYFDQPAPAGARWYKYDPDLGWAAYEHAVLSGDRKSVSLYLEDGGQGDEDGVANGIIVDPSALGFATDTTGSLWGNTAEANGTGCFIGLTASAGDGVAAHLPRNGAVVLIFLLTLGGLLTLTRDTDDDGKTLGSGKNAI